MKILQYSLTDSLSSLIVLMFIVPFAQCTFLIPLSSSTPSLSVSKSLRKSKSSTRISEFKSSVVVLSSKDDDIFDTWDPRLSPHMYPEGKSMD